jgi:SAM-dependent methyltransferase
MESEFYAALHQVQERHWWYAARRNLLAHLLRNLQNEGLPDGVIYDLGCGVGANLPVLERFGPVLGVDTSPEAVAFARSRGHENVRQADLNRLEGLEEGSASVVVLADVIEHLPDERPCLEAARRLLKPGGALIVTVPAFMFLWSPTDEVNHHYRRYTAGQLRRVIAPLFTLQKLTYFNTFLFGLIAAGRFTERLLKRDGNDAVGVPRWPVNGALQAIFEAEIPLLDRLSFPVGVSVLCVARRPD